MKKALFFVVIGVLSLSSCVSIKVVSDFDQEVDFTKYKTFAFYKQGVDEVKISDLDKKRILRAIEKELVNKGYVKSEAPDLLINFFTDEKEVVDVYNNYWGPGWGWGWGWGWGAPYSTVTSRSEGQIYVDIIDANRKALIWQGKGQSTIPDDPRKKEEKINEFIAEIFKLFPPE